MGQLRRKSIALTGLLASLLATHVATNCVSVITPNHSSRRGAQLSLLFSPHVAVTVIHAIITARGIICDLRKPNVMRIAPNPLYNSFADVYRFVMILKACVETHTITME